MNVDMDFSAGLYPSHVYENSHMISSFCFFKHVGNSISDSLISDLKIAVSSLNNKRANEKSRKQGVNTHDPLRPTFGITRYASILPLFTAFPDVNN